jgi:hypothetical protein
LFDRLKATTRAIVASMSSQLMPGM